MITVSDLELSVRSQNCLAANRVTTVAEFMTLSERRVRMWRNAGTRTWREIASVQANLRMEHTLQLPEMAADAAVAALNHALRCDMTLRACINPDGSIGLPRIIGD